MAKGKKPAPEKLVGIKPHKKRDLLEGCNEPGKPWFTPNPVEFQQAFCRICRNEECVRARGAMTPWHIRMETQVDRLLENPHFSDLSTEEHKRMAQQLFNDLRAKAERLEIASIRQDWEIPEGPTDGFERVVAAEANDTFNEAVRALSKERGHDPHDPQDPESQEPGVPEKPRGFSGPQEDGIEYSTQFPSSDGKTNYRVALTVGGVWTCECKGFQNLRRCKHLNQVKTWYEENQVEDEEVEISAPLPPPSPQRAPSPSHPQPTSPNLNTPMPHQGVMVGGGAVPTVPHSQLPAVPTDPWTPRKDTVVQPGATVTMKSKS